MTNQFPVSELAAITASPQNYRLLRKVDNSLLEQPITSIELSNADIGHFVVLDFETTGLDHKTAEIIEIGMVKVAYSRKDETILGSVDTFQSFEESKGEISELITSITGITADDVRGHVINSADVVAFLEGIDFIVCHNTAFDKPFFVKRFAANTELAELSWGCTAQGIKWSDFGIGSAKLEFILFKSGYFYEAHRASDDCFAVVAGIQANPGAMAQLLSSIRARTVTVRAVGAPFDVKDSLKGRGYSWCGEHDTHGKHWFRSVSDAAITEEMDFLNQLYADGAKRAVYETLTAVTRFI